jgi:hypothetical protein
MRWHSERNATASATQSDRNADPMLGRGLGLVREEEAIRDGKPVENARTRQGHVQPSKETA